MICNWFNVGPHWVVGKCISRWMIFSVSLKFKFDSVKHNHDVIYLHELQIIRALGNIIKHNVSTVDRHTSESAKFLVDECHIPNNSQLASLILAKDNIFNICNYIPKIYLSLLHLLKLSCNYNHQLLDMEYTEAYTEIFDILIPEVLKIDYPKLKIDTNT